MATLLGTQLLRTQQRGAFSTLRVRMESSESFGLFKNYYYHKKSWIGTSLSFIAFVYFWVKANVSRKI